MKKFQLPIILLHLVFILCFISSCGSDQSFETRTEKEQLTDLFLVFSTRSDIIEPIMQEALITAAESAGTAFKNALQNHPLRAQFISDLDPALQDYHQEAATAPAGIEGVEDRTIAIHHLLNTLLTAAKKSRITTDDLSLAILSAFAAYEQELMAEPISSLLQEEERELIDLMLLSILNQIELRKFPNTVLAWLEALGADVNFADLINQSEWTDGYEKNALLPALRSVETVLSDAIVLADKEALMIHQLNLIAMRDLGFLRTGLDLLFLADSIDLTPLIDRINTVGGIMAGLTEEQLVQSGVLSERDLLTYVVYDWIRPEMLLNYQPMLGLADELTQLGGTIPVSPDLSLFTNPYLAVFQLQYDLELCHRITKKKREQAEIEEFNLSGQLLSMAERYSWRKVQETYKQNAIHLFSGAMDFEKQAILSLLTHFWLYY